MSSFSPLNRQDRWERPAHKCLQITFLPKPLLAKNPKCISISNTLFRGAIVNMQCLVRIMALQLRSCSFNLISRGQDQRWNFNNYVRWQHKIVWIKLYGLHRQKKEGQRDRVTIARNEFLVSSRSDELGFWLTSDPVVGAAGVVV